MKKKYFKSFVLQPHVFLLERKLEVQITIVHIVSVNDVAKRKK